MKTFKIILYSLFCLILAACKPIEYIPYETVRTEYQDRLHRDSIYINDSTIIREKGDTVWLTRWRTEYRDRLLRDSIIIRDSIQVPYPVEKRLSKWQSIKLEVGGIAIGTALSLILAVLGIIFKFYRTYKR